MTPELYSKGVRVMEKLVTIVSFSFSCSSSLGRLGEGWGADLQSLLRIT